LTQIQYILFSICFLP